MHHWKRVSLFATRGAAAVSMMLFLVAMVGCGPRVRSTTLTIGDLQEAKRELQGELTEAPFLMERSSDSPQMTVTVDRLLNLSTDQLTPGDRAYLMNGVFEGNLREAFRQRNIKFVSSTDRVGDLGALSPDEDVHAFVGTLRSAGARGGTEGRVDLYRMEYELISLRDREIVWTGSFEFKRYAPGIVFD